MELWPLTHYILLKRKGLLWLRKENGELSFPHYINIQKLGVYLQVNPSHNVFLCLKTPKGKMATVARLCTHTHTHTEERLCWKTKIVICDCCGISTSRLHHIKARNECFRWVCSFTDECLLQVWQLRDFTINSINYIININNRHLFHISHKIRKRHDPTLRNQDVQWMQ